MAKGTLTQRLFRKERFKKNLIRLHQILFIKCNGFEITSASGKHVVEDDILFTNHFWWETVTMGLLTPGIMQLTSASHLGLLTTMEIFH